MDISGFIIFAGLLLLIVFYIRDIKSMIVPAKKSNLEIIAVTLGSFALLMITILYGKNYFHYLLGVLSIIVMILTLLRKGITSAGFRSIRGINTGNWGRLKSVRVSRNNGVKIDYIAYNSYLETLYFKDEVYNKIIEILQNNLSPGILRIV